MDGQGTPDSPCEPRPGVEFGAPDDGSACASGEDENIDSGNGFDDLMERVEENIRMSEGDTDTNDEGSIDEDGDYAESGVEHGDTGLNGERYDHFPGDVDNGMDQQHVAPEIYSSPEGGVGASGAIPRIHLLHTMAPSFASTKTVEGGSEGLRYNTKARGSPFYPFPSKEQQLIFDWQHVHRISKGALRGLLDVLLMKYEGEPFDVSGLAGIDPDHFYGRTWLYLPLLPLLEREVPSAHDGTTSASVYDIPVNLLLDRVMQIQTESALSKKYAGGKLLRGDEAAENLLTSDHVNCVPTRRAGNVMNSNHNGTLARSTPFFGFDGIRARVCGRKVYVNDTCMCEVDGEASLCRILEIFYDGERRLVLVSVRLFRGAGEVRDVGEEVRRGGLLRVWEDCTPGNKLELKATDVLGLVEMGTPPDAGAVGGQHSSGGGHSFPWDSLFGEGFVRKAGGRKRRHRRNAMSRPYHVFESPWCQEGSADKPLFGLRREGVHLNDTNLPFYSAPVVFSNDAFNAFGMGCKVRLVLRLPIRNCGTFPSIVFVFRRFRRHHARMGMVI